jgi:hypothetical protein
MAEENTRPEVTQTVSFRTDRPQIVGPDDPEPPFPIRLLGPVQRGFGRGGKDLGCPTGLQCTLVITGSTRMLI